MGSGQPTNNPFSNLHGEVSVAGTPSHIARRGERSPEERAKRIANFPEHIPGLPIDPYRRS
jgi:hypothetical protein